MYHEVRKDGQPLCNADAGYARYCVPEPAFRSQLESLAQRGYAGWSLSEALERGSVSKGCAITFDDGAETDLTLAAPLLRQHGFNATFFVVSGWVGRAGFMSAAQLRELHREGFEIGAHSTSHAYLSDLPHAVLNSEVRDCKDQLEQLLGAAVVHLSCPGGRWSRAVADLAREVGFQSVSTSRIAANTAHSDRFRLARVPVMQTTELPEFLRICQGDRLWLKRVRSDLLAGLKNVFGNTLYERLRHSVLTRQ